MTNSSKLHLLIRTSIIVCVLFFVGVALIVPQMMYALTVSPVRLELSANPGETVTTSMKAFGDSSPKTFYPNVYTFEAGDETGNPRILPNRHDLATWISVADSVTVPALETLDVPIKITVPKDADPGGYFAAVTLSQNPPTEGKAGEIAIGSEVGTLILFRVNGDIEEGADILNFSTKDGWFFTELPITFFYRFQNAGNDRIKPLGDIYVRNVFKMMSKQMRANPTDGSILPKSIRRFEVVWEAKHPGTPKTFWQHVQYQAKNFAFGRYTAQLSLAYGQPGSLTGASSQTSFWVVPWQFLTVVMGGLLILLVILRFIIRRYNRFILRKAAGGTLYRKK